MRSCHCPGYILLAAALSLGAIVMLGVPQTSQAVEYSILYWDFQNNSGFSETGPAPVDSAGSWEHDFRYIAWYNMRAGYYGQDTFLGALQRTLHYDCSGYSNPAELTSQMTCYDIEFSHPTLSEMTVTLNLRVKGYIHYYTVMDDPCDTAVGCVETSVNMNLATSGNGQMGKYCHSATAGSYDQSGAFSTVTGQEIDGVFTSQPFTVPVGVPMSLAISMKVHVSTNGSGSHAIINFGGPVPDPAGNGLGFPLGTPVFNLPSGATVNSTECEIENNVWRGSSVPVEHRSWGSVKALYR